jgi:hypothetical protein
MFENSNWEKIIPPIVGSAALTLAGSHGRKTGSLHQRCCDGLDAFSFRQVHGGILTTTLRPPSLGGGVIQCLRQAATWPPAWMPDMDHP